MTIIPRCYRWCRTVGVPGSIVLTSILGFGLDSGCGQSRQATQARAGHDTVPGRFATLRPFLPTTLGGWVRNSDGAPVAGVEVHLFPLGNIAGPEEQKFGRCYGNIAIARHYIQTTDSAGHFVFRRPDASVTPECDVLIAIPPPWSPFRSDTVTGLSVSTPEPHADSVVITLEISSRH